MRAPGTEPAAQPSGCMQVLLAPFATLGEIILFWTVTFLGLMEFLGDVLIVIGKSLGFMLRGAISWRLTVAQMAFLGVDSMGIILICVGFTGMTMASALMDQVARYGVGKDLVGGGILYVMCKELAPVLTGLILAGRAGAGMASEIGSMKVTEQIDALRATGVHPIRYLSVPRILANLLMCPLLTFAAAVVGVVAGYVSAHYFSPVGLSFTTYFNSVENFWHFELLRTLIKKSLVFGLIVSAVAVTEGFNAQGSAAAVGRATTRAVVNAMVLIFLVDMLMTIVFDV